MRKAKLIFPVWLLLAISGCIQPEQYPETPRISFSRFSAPSVRDGEALSVFIDFTDGDGDIGVPDGTNPQRNYNSCNPPDSAMMQDAAYAIFYRNTVDTLCLTAYQLPFIAPQGKYKSLKGEIELKLTASAKIACPSGNCIDSAKFQLVLRDRAGHLSNTIVTPSVAIVIP
ncbi:MAG: hypothetical protein U0T84_11010 [Chitinophagales bacterium]